MEWQRYLKMLLNMFYKMFLAMYLISFLGNDDRWEGDWWADRRVQTASRE